MSSPRHKEFDIREYTVQPDNVVGHECVLGRKRVMVQSVRTEVLNVWSKLTLWHSMYTLPSTGTVGQTRQRMHLRMLLRSVDVQC